MSHAGREVVSWLAVEDSLVGILTRGGLDDVLTFNLEEDVVGSQGTHWLLRDVALTHGSRSRGDRHRPASST